MFLSHTDVSLPLSPSSPLRISKMFLKVAIGDLHILIITLNVNGPNSPVKKAQCNGMDKKPTIHCVQESHLSCNNKQMQQQSGK